MDAHEPEPGATTDEPNEPASEPESSDGFDSFLAALASSPPPYRPPRLTPGEVFDDRYLVDRELGRGGMGTVYLAEDLELRRKVALKVAAGRRTEVELLRLQQEAKVMAQLSHPGIVTVFEAKAVGEGIYLALEFIPGGTVRDWFDLQTRTWREVVAMFIDIAIALAAAHEATVVHRDFKPHNVLLGLDGKPRIADFGLARSAHARTSITAPVLADTTLTQSGAVMGTPAYMAPEQAEGEEATARSDQFSFFVSLYEGICGRRPFGGKTLAALLEEIESGPPDRFPGMPRALAHAIRRGLAYDPEQRYSSMSEVAAALRRVAAARRRRIQAAAVGVGALVAVSAGFFAAPEQADPCTRKAVSASVDRLWTEEANAGVQRNNGPVTAQHIDDFTDALVDERMVACEAHTVEATLSDEDFSLTGACLDRLEGRLAGLLDDLGNHPGEASSRSLTGLLAPPERCRDRQSLRRASNAYAPRSSLRNPQHEQAVFDGIRALTELTLRSGRAEDITAELDALEALAREKELPGIEGYAALLRASGEQDPARIEALLDQAAAAASQTENTDLLSDLALRRSNLAFLLDDIEQAEIHLDHAETLRRLSVLQDDRSADAILLDLARLQLEVYKGNSRASIEPLETLLAKLDEDGASALQALSLLGDAQADAGFYSDADETYGKALAHPGAADPHRRQALHLNRGLALLGAGRTEEAQRAIDAAIGVSVSLESMPTGIRAPIEVAQAHAAKQQGELEAATRHSALAEHLLSELDPRHPNLAYVYDIQSEVGLAAGDLETAVARGKQALALWDAALGPGSAEAGATFATLAEIVRQQGRTEKAIEVAGLAITILEKESRPADEIARARYALALALESSDPAAAAEALAQATRDCTGSERVDCKPILAHD